MNTKSRILARSRSPQPGFEPGSPTVNAENMKLNFMWVCARYTTEDDVPPRFRILVKRRASRGRRPE